jgi:hypothetical protein
VPAKRIRGRAAIAGSGSASELVVAKAEAAAR